MDYMSKEAGVTLTTITLRSLSQPSHPRLHAIIMETAEHLGTRRKKSGAVGASTNRRERHALVEPH